MVEWKTWKKQEMTSQYHWKCDRMFFPIDKRLNQIESRLASNAKLFLLLKVCGEKKGQFEGGEQELKCTTTIHKTITIVHVYQYTSY